MEKIQKDKYIIYNENYEILIFTSLSLKKTIKVLLPSLSKYDYDNKGEFHSSIKELLVGEDACYLGQSVYPQMVYNQENGKLKKNTIQVIRNYYSCYKKMTHEDCIMLMELCYKNDVLPHFITIEELKQLIAKRRLALYDFDIDMCMNDSLNELQKRLSFEKY